MFKNIVKKIINKTGYDVKKVIKNKRHWPEQLSNPQTFFEIDKGFQNLYNLAQLKTQMQKSDNPLRQQRHYTLNYLLWSTDIKNTNVCELGCWRGLSSYQIAYHIKGNNFKSTFHIFDSFEGLSEIESIDEIKNNIDRRKYFACDIDIVKRNLSDFDFIKYYKGWIPDRFDEVKDEMFSFVHIDLDLYQPIYDSIEFFYPRLIKNGVMVFDDYGCIDFPGAKKAVDAYLKKINNPFFIPLPSGQAFLMKSD